MDDLFAIVIGVVFGIAASVPTSLLIVAATAASSRKEHASYRRPTSPAQPEPIDVEYRPVDSWGVEVAEFQPQGKPRIIG